MIRHHEAQDSLSAEAAPMILASSLTAAPLPGYAPIQSSAYSNQGAAANHPFSGYGTQLSIIVLMVMAVLALLILLKAAANRLRFTVSTRTVGNVYFVRSGRHGYSINRR